MRSAAWSSVTVMMKGTPGASPSIPEGGEQFPPLDDLTPPAEDPVAEDGDPSTMGAMDRLTARQNQSGEQGSSKTEGFEASVHRIKEQVLPRLLKWLCCRGQLLQL